MMIALLLLAGFTTMQAQKGNVSKAKNKVLVEENQDFAGARTLIEEALKDETTKDQANTWYVAGLIGYRQNAIFDKKAVMNEPEDPDVVGKVILESYNYLLTADSLDQLPNEKGKVKPRFRKDIKKMVTEYYKYNLVNYGAHLFDKHRYDEALGVFKTYLTIPDLPLVENEIQKDSTYNMIQYFAAIAATNAEKGEEAIKLYEGLKGKDYEELTVYQLLAEEYKKMDDNDNYLKTLNEGVNKFPKELWFIQNLINEYISADKKDEALTFLDKAISNSDGSDTDMLAQFYFVKGGLYESQENFAASAEAYQKAVDLSPSMAGAYEGLGRLHYNAAVMIDNDREANAEFQKAIPFYEKAVELNPDEKSYSVLLRTLYYRLGMDKKYEALEKEMKVKFPELF